MYTVNSTQDFASESVYWNVPFTSTPVAKATSYQGDSMKNKPTKRGAIPVDQAELKYDHGAKKQKNKDGNIQVHKAREEKFVKPKGPVPESYKLNKARKATQLEQEARCLENERNERAAEAMGRLEAKLTACQLAYPSFLAGIPGEYTIGVERNGSVFFEDYFVGTMPYGKNMAIFGFKDVYVPHFYLFADEASCWLANDWKSGIQMKMLDFLRGTLASEIKAVSSQVVVKVPSPTLATSDGKAVKPTPAIVAKVVTVDFGKILSLATFTADKIGRFDFSDGNENCHVVQKLDNGKMTLRVTSISIWHPLAKAGIRVGLWLRSESLGQSIPVTALHELGAEYFAHANILKAFILMRLEKFKRLNVA